MKEQLHYDTIKQLNDGLISKSVAISRLGISRRHVDRLLASYKLNGKSVFSHSNRGSTSPKAIPSDLQLLIVQLYQDKYYGANLTHFTELLARNEGISLSRTTINSYLSKYNIISPKAHRSTRKRFIDRNKQLVVTSPHPSRPRKKYPGELIQMDASNHHWIASEYWHLHAAIDDATGHIVGAHFSKEETLDSYYIITQQLLTNYGIPHEILTDYRTVFKSSVKPDSEANPLTQYGYMCNQLGIQLSSTMIPQAKGRVERLFGTLQSRLVTEFRLLGISTLEQANNFLSSFLPQFNKQFGILPYSNTSVWETPPSDDKINQLCAVLSPRIIQAGHHIQFQNNKYLPINSSGSPVHFPYKTKSLVIQALDKSLWVSINDTIYSLRRLETHDIHSPEFDKAVPTSTKKITIPPASHPWREASFKKYLEKQAKRKSSQSDWDSLYYSQENSLANNN
jgi:transposase InsO family protein